MSNIWARDYFTKTALSPQEKIYNSPFFFDDKIQVLIYNVASGHDFSSAIVGDLFRSQNLGTPITHFHDLIFWEP